jgi:polyisoprenoid-binding protein YceI
MNASGTYQIGPHNGRLLLRTFREGVAAMVGHDLVIEATGWRGTVTVPEGGQPHIAVEVDVRSLEVREGLHGAKPLTDRDRQEIKETMAELLGADHDPLVSYVSGAVQLAGGSATVDGQLTLLGVTQPLRLAIQAGDGVVTATATVQQSRWGIKPYKAFMGALKVRDEVEVEATVRLG